MNWQHYNNALILEEPLSSLSSLDQQQIRREALRLVRKHRALFARWTSDIDSPSPTEWWYCLRDQPVSLDAFSAKQRYRIRRGLDNANYIRIFPDDTHLIEQMWPVAVASFANYPAKYRPTLRREAFLASVASDMKELECWGCIDKSSNSLVGYAFCKVCPDRVSLSVVKVHPDALKNEINAGLAYTLCFEYLNQRAYPCICDGERNIRHETNYQQFLVRVLGFHLVYCRLNVVYHPMIALAVRLLFPFRHCIQALSVHSKLLYNIYSLLRQEEIARSFLINNHER